MDIEVSEQTLKVGAIIVVALVVLGVIALGVTSGFFTWPASNSTNTTPISPKPAPIVLPPEIQAMVSIMCADRDLAIKYEQDPTSGHPQLIKLRPTVLQYEQATGKKFNSKICFVG